MFLAQWLQYLINEVAYSDTIPWWGKIRKSETIRIEKTVNIDFSAQIV
jgi:hypothetical protein